MVEGNYSITARILEASDLLPKPGGFLGFGASDVVNPYISVKVRDQVKLTVTKDATSNPVYAQALVFKFINLTKQELLDTTIRITAYNQRKLPYRFLKNEIIGEYELDLTSVYFSHQHELYHTWLTLTDPDDERDGALGYVFVNVSVLGNQHQQQFIKEKYKILGPHDEPAVHDITTESKPGSGKEQILAPQKIEQIPHQIDVEIYKAEHLAPVTLESFENNTYIEAKYSSSVLTTTNIKGKVPEWNQKLFIQCQLPNKSKFITFSLFNYNLTEDDQLIGRFKIPFKDFREKDPPQPRWINIYGSPLTPINKEQANLMNLFGEVKGTHYRGRVFLQITSYYDSNVINLRRKLEFKFPNNPYPSIPTKRYILRVDILEAFELPKRLQAIIHIVIGPYILTTKTESGEYPGKKQEITDGRAQFYKSLEDKKLIFPTDVTQIPDLIIYFADENIESRRHCYIRIKPSDIMVEDGNFEAKNINESYKKKQRYQIYQFKEERSLDLVKDDEVPGFICASIKLMNQLPIPISCPERENIIKQIQSQQIEYQLRVYLYIGRNLPPADKSGTSDAVAMIKCCGQSKFSQVIEQTLNPGWFEIITLDIKCSDLQKEQQIPLGMFLMIYDTDLGKTDEDDENYFTEIQQKLGFSKAPTRVRKRKLDSNIQEEQLHTQIEKEEKDKKYQEDMKKISQGKKEILGRSWINIKPKQKLYKKGSEYIPIWNRKPKWYNIIYDPTDEKCGEVLLSYVLIKKEDIEKVKKEHSIKPPLKQFTIVSNIKQEDIEKVKKEESIKPPLKQQIQKTFIKKLYIFNIGLRDIDTDHEDNLIKNIRKIQLNFSISGDKRQFFTTNMCQVKNRGVNYNQKTEVDIELPKNRYFCPILEVCAWEVSEDQHHEKPNMRAMIGFGQLDIFDIVIKDYKELLNEQEIKELSQDNEKDEFEELFRLQQNMDNMHNELPNQDKATKKKKLENFHIMIPNEKIPIKKQFGYIHGKYGKEHHAKDDQQSQIVSSHYGSNAVNINTMLQNKNLDHADVQSVYADEQQSHKSEKQKNILYFNDQVSVQNLNSQASFDQKQLSEISAGGINVPFISPDKKQLISQNEFPEDGNYNFRIQSNENFEHVLSDPNENLELKKNANVDEINLFDYSKFEHIQEQNNENNQHDISQISDTKNQQGLDQQFYKNQRKLSNEIDANQPENIRQQILNQGPQQSPQNQNLQYKDHLIQNPSQQDLLPKQQIQENSQNQQVQNIQTPIIVKKNNKNQEIHLNIFNQQQLDSQQQQQQQDSQQQNLNLNKEIIIDPSKQSEDGGGEQQEEHKKNNEENKDQVGILQNKQINLQLEPTKYNIQNLPQQMTLVGGKPESTQVYENFQVKTNWKVSKATKLSSRAISYSQVPPDNEKGKVVFKHGKKSKKEKKASKARQLLNNLLGLLKKKIVKIPVEKYEDFNSDEDEDFDMTPPWMKNPVNGELRKVLNDDLEDTYKAPKKLVQIPLIYGSSREKIQETKLDQSMQPHKTATLKCVFLQYREGKKPIQDQIKEYVSKIKPKDYVCRVYITKGIGIGGAEAKRDLYLKVYMQSDTDESKIINQMVKQSTLCKQTNNPDFFYSVDIPCKLPGSSILVIKVMEALGQMENIRANGDEIVGETKIDLETRYFNAKWLEMNKVNWVPMEQRNLVRPPPNDAGSEGRLEMWIELFPVSEVKYYPMHKITAPPKYDMELRVIVWQTQECVFKDVEEECNDVYVKGSPANLEFLETDIHWRCRSKGSFNWRWKYPVKFPIQNEDDYGADQFKVQIYDKDITSSDEIIGETTVDLNIHNLILKAVKRQKPVQMRRRIVGPKPSITDRLWFEVFNPLEKDETGKLIPQGQVCLSFELVPKSEAEKKVNSNGRDPPNIFPILAEPQGRLSFDILHPLDFVKMLVGPNVYNTCVNSICCIILTIILSGFLWFILTGALGARIAK